MRLALRECEKGIRKGGGPFGCVIVKTGRVVGAGHNTVVNAHDCTAHAEVNALRNAGKKLKTHDLTGCVVYTTTEPCPMCFTAIHWGRVKKVFYGCTRKDASKIGFDDKHFYDILEHKARDEIAEQQICRNECVNLFKQWVKNPRHKNY